MMMMMMRDYILGILIAYHLSNRFPRMYEVVSTMDVFLLACLLEFRPEIIRRKRERDRRETF